MVRSPDVRVRRLQKADDRSGFHCGNADLDRFFQRFAGQNQFRHHIGTTYVAELNGRIVGFATVSPGEVGGEEIAAAIQARLQRYPLPVLRLSRLAVDVDHQGRGIGKALLRWVFELSLQLRDSVGCTGVVVDAKPESVGFYRTLGFIELDAAIGTLGDRPEPVPMFLAVKRIEQAMR